MKEVQPHLQVLNTEHIDFIHRKSIEVLQTIGVRVDSPRARQLFQKAGDCQVDDDRVKIGAEVVQFAIEAAPATIDIFDRHGGHRFELTSQNPQTRFGVGVTNLYFHCPDTGKIEAIQR